MLGQLQGYGICTPCSYKGCGKLQAVGGLPLFHGTAKYIFSIYVYSKLVIQALAVVL